MSRPLYTVIQQYIEDQIRAGVWHYQHQIPTERELSEQFKVSRITAKSAVMGLVNRGLLSRQRGKGTFVAVRDASANWNDASSKPATVAKKLVGFMIPWVEFRYSSLLLAGAEAALSEQGFHVLFKRTKTKAGESQAIREFLDVGVEGMIFASTPGEHFNDDIVRLALNKFPVVLVEKTIRDIRVNSVYCDTERAGALMADYLLQQGCREVALVTYPAQFCFGVKERIFGFQAALLDHGVRPLTEDRILSVEPDILIGLDQRVPADFAAFLARHPQLDSIAAVDALLAKLIGHACAASGRHDIRIICCDEPSCTADALFPSAYIDQSPLDMGRMAAEQVMAAIAGDTEPRKEVVEPKLVRFNTFPSTVRM